MKTTAGHKKRASESSALTTVSSLRSSAAATSGRPSGVSQMGCSGGEIDSQKRLKNQRTPLKVSSTLCPADERHFPFPPSDFIGQSTTRVSGGGGLEQQMSVQSSISNLAETSSNLERDLEIIDLLERERSMDIQQGLERERLELGMRPVERRRRLPSVGRQGQLRRNLVTDTDPFETLFTSDSPPISEHVDDNPLTTNQQQHGRMVNSINHPVFLSQLPEYPGTPMTGRSNNEHRGSSARHPVNS